MKEDKHTNAKGGAPGQNYYSYSVIYTHSFKPRFAVYWLYLGV